MPLAAGATLGHFKILSQIGAGGMGEVYRATDTRLKRDVALKLLPEAFAHDSDRLARITREAEVLASLNHPNIATIYGVEDRALVMELVEGEAPAGPLSFDAAWQIASQIVDALEYAHEKGIVHRDLKPANVKVNSDGMVKLLDFGLAKAFSEPAAPSGSQEHSPTITIGATQVGMILGTAGYMSPEQAKGKSVDRRADIWAFGALLYELLTGQRLFAGEDISETLAQVLTKEPDLSQVPARARKLLRRCLEKDPRKRLRDIGEARHHIDEPPVSAPARRRNAVLPWAIAVAALVVAAAVYGMRPARQGSTIRTFILPPEHTSFRSLGDAAGPAVLSPDGKSIAFTVDEPDGKTRLWVRPLDSVTAQPLAGTEGAMFPFWSPNSRSLGFFADGKLKRIDAAGGTINVLADTPFTRGGTWNQDDVILFSPGFTTALVSVPASGGAPTPVTRLDEKQHELAHRWPSFLPDGKHFVYTSRGHGIFVASLDSSETPKRLLDENSNALYSSGYLLYSRANLLLAQPFDLARREFTGAPVTIAQSLQAEVNSNRACFTASNDGSLAYHHGLGESQPVWFDRKGNRLGAVGEPGLFKGVELAPDGKRVALIVGDGSGGASVWIYEFAGQIKWRFTSGSAFNIGVAWSPDGRRMAIGMRREGGYDVHTKEVGGAGSEDLLFRSNVETGLGFWLPNGDLTIASRNPKTGYDIYRLPPAGKGIERTAVPLLVGDGDQTGGSVSPDGKWILYGSDESGVGFYQIFLADFPSGKTRRQLFAHQADFGRWVSHGKEVIFASRRKLMAADVRVAGNTSEAATPRELFEMRTDCATFEFTCFDVAPDGSRFLVLEPTGSPPPVALIQNWTAGLKK